MPNIKSAIKRVKTAEKRTLNNSIIKSEYKTAVRKYEKAIENGSEEASKLLSAAKKAINHAGTKGVISKNAAARKVSRIEKKLGLKAEAKKDTPAKAEKKVAEDVKVEDKKTEPAKKTAEKKATTAKKTATKKTTAKKTTKKATEKKAE